MWKSLTTWGADVKRNTERARVAISQVNPLDSTEQWLHPPSVSQNMGFTEEKEDAEFKDLIDKYTQRELFIKQLQVLCSTVMLLPFHVAYHALTVCGRLFAGGRTEVPDCDARQQFSGHRCALLC